MHRNSEKYSSNNFGIHLAFLPITFRQLLFPAFNLESCRAAVKTMIIRRFEMSQLYSDKGRYKKFSFLEEQVN